VRRAAEGLKYRDFLTVVLIVKKKDVFPDNWIYVHTPHIHVGRIQNYKNWSAAMVPDPQTTCLGMEYFCNEGDALWSRGDDDLVELARREVVAIGFAEPEEIFDGAVLRQKKAYPVYDPTYRGHLDRLRDYLLRFENLQMIGRNGLHKYDNQDHAMLTALLAVKNILGGRHDVWGVNASDEYLEVQPNPSAD
jgi:protoporphyrinogen oxidase